MDETATPVDPADIRRINLLISAWAEPDIEFRPVKIDLLHIASDATETLLSQVKFFCQRGKTLVVLDDTPMRRGQDDLKKELLGALSKQVSLTERVLTTDSNGHVDASIELARELADQLQAFDALVSIGSGTVTDIAKYARHLRVQQDVKRLPFVCYPTAASVTAYTSALAVLTVGGVKRTLPARAPDVVICDLETLASAPVAMSRAGFGDVLARSVSYGDWYLANQLGMDDGFTMVPARLLDHAEQQLFSHADGISSGNPEATRCLTHAVLLAGMAMTIVNQTAPLSGWEHAMSHYFDLTAAHDRRSVALHGAQVGVATLVSALAYEKTWKEMWLGALIGDTYEESSHRQLEEVIAELAAPAALAGELHNDLDNKLARWSTAGDQRKRFFRLREVDNIDSPEKHVQSAETIRHALTRAGCCCRFSELDPPIADQTALNAILRCHLIRARFTYGDLLAATGWLTADHALDLLESLG